VIQVATGAMSVTSIGMNAQTNVYSVPAGKCRSL